jgi:Holliday junction resolvase-like predicted endonuclease
MKANATNKMTQYHVAVAAEAFAAGLFARQGCDVSVQYGANQPGYDLIIARGGRLLRVSVKGSQDGSWGLTQSYKNKDSTYHAAVDCWLSRQPPATLFCLVQFYCVEATQMPRVYLAWPYEIAQVLKGTSGGRGDTILYEHKVWTARAHCYGTVDRIPDSWQFSEQRLAQVLAETEREPVLFTSGVTVE